MVSSVLFSTILGVISLIYAPKAVQFEYRITNRRKVYWDLVNRSRKALKEGNVRYSQQLRNLSKGHLTQLLQMERRRRLVAIFSVLLIGGLYGAMSAMGIVVQ